jgi:hypothetical protein
MHDEATRLRVLRCHTAGPLVRWTEMEATDAEKLKGRRAQRFIYLLMAVMIALPFFVLLVRNG